MDSIGALKQEESKLQRWLTALKGAIAVLNGGSKTIVSPVTPAVLSELSVPVQAQSDPASIYKANCAECHGTNGNANTAMGRLTT